MTVDGIGSSRPGVAKTRWNERKRGLPFGRRLPWPIPRSYVPSASSSQTLLETEGFVVISQTEEGGECWVLAQAMADVATIGILHERSIARREGSLGSSRWRSTPGWSSSRPKASSPRRRGPIWTKPSRSWAAMPGITTSCSPRWHDR